jgi:GntR family transcriptional regulator/MocR family aminotransferase
MSKVMFPGLRLGYMVVPEHLVPAFRAVRGLADTHPPMSIQPALAEFIEAGHLSAHIRRMRALYAERQRMLLRACEAHLSRWLQAAPDEAGMHLVATLRDGLDDRAVTRLAREQGVEAPALSSYYRSLPPRKGLLLGYAGVGEGEIAAAARRLADALVMAERGG